MDGSDREPELETGNRKPETHAGDREPESSGAAIARSPDHRVNRSKPRRWLPRFTLRTLLLFVLLCASGFGLWWRWEPWLVSWRIEGHKGPVRYAEFSKDGRYILTASWDKTIKIWDRYTRELFAVIESPTEGVEFASFAPGGNSIVSVGRDALRITEIPSLKEHVLDNGGGASWIHEAQFSPNGKLLILPRISSDILLWDVEHGGEVAELEGHESGVTCAAWSPNGMQFASGSHDGTALVWDVAAKSSRLVFNGHLDDAKDPRFPPNINSIAFSSDGKWIATGSEDGTARFWNAETGSQSLVLQTRRDDSSEVASVSISADERCLVTACSYEEVWIWSLIDGTLLYQLAPHIKYVHSAVFSPDGNEIVTASDDGSSCLLSRRRPEYWWGIAWLPEFWLTILFGIGLLWSLYRDFRMLRAKSVPRPGGAPG